MKPMSSADIRQAFLDFFTLKQHELVASSSLVPANDPTLLFVNAGMVQFKDTFLGQEFRDYTRAVSVQRCVRAGGKHNDLDQVGYTARHHTLFEMLGNFSFGDYFKREAIQFAWAFLTEVLKLPAEKLWVTVYKDDEEAASIWLDEMGVSKERFSRCGDADNFWSMGDTGPCGPCSEIFYDHGPDVAGGPPGTPEQEGDRYVEIWNLVFMQYNRDASGAMHALAKPSVDTGMGLERIAAVLQGVHSNYDTDIFKQLKQAVVACADGEKPEMSHPSLNVIADHIRACAFLVMDGVLPSNEGRGYVLRRIIRRAVRHGHHLKLVMPFFSQLVKPLVDVMGDAYPELKKQQAHIEATLADEEVQFAATLEHGLTLLKAELAHIQNQILPGQVAFKLYDTYGFPLDLTQDILREQGIRVDTEGFDACMSEQRARSQKGQGFQADYQTMTPFTEQSDFLGYSDNTAESEVLALRVDGDAADAIEAGTKAFVVLAQTPFYAESGGQVGDTGVLRSVSGDAVFRVEDTQKLGDAIVHQGELVQGSIKLHDKLVAEIDDTRRQAIRLNHSATHLLHAVLKKILGDGVAQKGSLVEAKRARFDFTYNKAMTADELKQVELEVNAEIRANNQVETDVMSMDDAMKAGAVALFGEKYGSKVRVLTMGALSQELCGGTHVNRTGDIGLFKITSESGIAKGVRRLEFVTGAYALDYVAAQEQSLHHAADLLKGSPKELLQKLKQLIAEDKQKGRLVTELKAELAKGESRKLQDEFQDINGTKVLLKQLDNVEPRALRELLDQVKSFESNGVIVLIAKNSNKMHVLASVGKACLEKGAPKAPEFVKLLCGRGGGRDDMAQGGGELPSDLEARIEQALALL